MSDENMEVEITVAPAKGRRCGRKAGSKVADQPRIPRITRLMALAITFQDMIDRGEVRDYADIARLGYVTRARITQIMNLLMLAPDLQEELLLFPLNPGVSQPAERHVRRVVSDLDWKEQRRLWNIEHR